MKNWDKKPESLFKKKGFYVALYSCLGVVMISAAALSFTNLLKSDPPSPINTQSELGYGNTDLGDLQPADNSSVQSYLTPEDREISKAMPTATPIIAGTPRPTPEPSDGPDTTRTQTQEQTQTQTQEPAPAVTPASESQKEPDKQTSDNTVAPDEAVSEATNPEPDNQDSAVAETPAGETPSFATYTAEDPMKWPLTGELVMDFSMDKLIYDETLHMFRTNDNLCIAATVGTQVKAAAEGVVKEIDKTREKGNTVTLDHGNGWTTVYSELQDGILVGVGDIVQEGQVIGGVGSPAIYNVLMGSHLQFAVAKDGVAVDPKKILVN